MMSFTSRLFAPERVSQGMAWAFIFLLGAAAAVSLGLSGAAESAGTHSAAADMIANVTATVAHATGVLVDVAGSVWQTTVRELARVVRALLDWQWWPFEISLGWTELSGGANVFHS